MEQDYKGLEVIRAAAALTTAYVAATVTGTHGLSNQLILLVDYTKGASDDMRLKVEFSSDGTNYYQETMSTLSTGVDTTELLEHKLGASGAYRLVIPIKDQFVKVSVKATTSAVNTSCKITSVIGTA